MPTLDNLRSQIVAYEPVSFAHKEFKAAVAAIMNSDPQPSNEECIQRVREEIPVECMFSRMNLTGPTTIYRILRDYLVLNGFQYSAHPQTSHRAISMGIAHSLLEYDEDKNVAYQNWATRVGHPDNSHTTNNDGNHQGRNQNGMEERHIAHNLSNRFRKDDKFTGKLGEDIDEFIANYDDAVSDFALSGIQQLKYFHLVFDGEAKQFYRRNIANKADSYEIACSLMRNEYNSFTRQNHVRKFLQGLRLQAIMDKKNCSPNEALEELRSQISKFAPQGPKNHRSEEDKVEYLHDAVIGIDWAQSALTQSVASNPAWNFQQLYTALDSAYLQHQKQKEGSSRDQSKAVSSSMPGILWESQRTYGNPKNKFRKGKRCFTCGSKFHVMKNCDKRKNFVESASRYMKTGRDPKKVLYELCVQAQEIFDVLHTEIDAESEDSEDPFETHLLTNGENSEENSYDSTPEAEDF